MKRHATILVGLSAIMLLTAGASVVAQEQSKAGSQPVQAEHGTDTETASRYANEATQLRAKAESHRSLARQYRARTGGKSNYAQIAEHCDRLAKFYEDAAQEAEAISTGLSKANK